ncbi:MAG: protein kinase [bacterium]|nr:protein kinase [bacterium]
MSDSVDKGRWRRIAALLDELLELPESERPARLAALCEDDAELRAEIEALLEVEGRTGLLDVPAEDYLASLIQEAEEKTGRDKAGVDAALRPGSGSTSSRPSETANARFLPGTLLDGRYRIVNRVGRGGMGEVFRADDLKLGQAVALKFLSERLASGEELKARFLSEVKLARQVAHPNVCRVYDVGETDGQLYLSMEFIEGEDLSSLLKRIGRLPREKAVQIAQQLCAGLAAAHAEGILHRDLKPANVMLDERGRVRITDFGLAGLAEEIEGAEVMSGTPAYMSPEQLAGQGVSVQSDLYALGLLLYELFTGKRPFEGRSRDEVRQARERTPSTPSSHVSGIDPTVERVILRCLEKDPGERPASAFEVATALPGGDPLAAALAAGETPSPEMVAAAGPDGRLRPRAVGLLLVAIAAMLGTAAYLAPKSSLIGLVPLEKPVAALVDDAREMLAGLGYDEPPVDHAYFLSADRDYRRYLMTTDRTPARWQPLATPGQVAFRFEYRQSPEPLGPLGQTGQVTEDDPPAKEGDILVVTDLRGRLRSLRVVPPATSGSDPASSSPDWPALFDAAGLDIGQFQPTTPTRQPRTFAQVRAAWLGVLPEVELPVRIEAAATGGRPTLFECILPSSPNWIEPGSDAGPEAATGGLTGFPLILWRAMLLAMLVLPVFLAARNLRLGRSDRRGANRFAAGVFTFRMLWWFFAGHHIPRLDYELFLLGNAVARSLFVAVMAWLFYLAIESHTRRLWPRILISWSRLLAGRVRDPLVGRHLLMGVAWGLLIVLPARELYFLIPRWLGWPDPPRPIGHPFWPFFAPTTDPLLGTRIALGAVASSLMGALWASLAGLSVLIGLLALVRRKWIALPLFVLFMGPNMPTAQISGHSWLGITIGILMGVLLCWIFVRFGLLATVTSWFTLFVFLVFPITVDPAAPYFGTSLFALAIVAALAGFGAWTSIGGRPVAVKAG